LKTSGAAGVLALSRSAEARSAEQRYGAIPLPLSGAITSRALTEVSRSRTIPVGSPFRFGLALKQRDVPSGSSLQLKDGTGNVLSAQFDAINYWPDGSVRFCEVRGYTARTISAGRTDMISISRLSGAFDNALPGGKTASQLLTDMQSFAGAQDLIVACDSVASITGQSNPYSSGNWRAHFNKLLAGSYVQQTNKGPCCMGFRAWGQLTNGTIDHAHLHICAYVWLWLDPSTGAIRDVEYLAYLHNSLLNQSADGTSYTAYPPDRYNYNPSINNGSTAITTFTLNPGSMARTATCLAAASAGVTSITLDGTMEITIGAVLNIIPNGIYSNAPWQRVTVTGVSENVVSFTPPSNFAFTSHTQVSGVGGHWPRAGWFTARSDGKPRWAKGSLEAQTLHVTLDPMQSNPQSITMARNYFLSTALTPKQDLTINANPPPTGDTPIQYAPMVKGLFVSESFSDWFTYVPVDVGGDRSGIGFVPNWNMRDLCLQTVATAQNQRITALGYMTHPSQWLDVNGQVPNLRNQPYTGMTATQPTTWCNAAGFGGTNVSATTEVHTDDYMVCGNWGSGEGGSANTVADTTHWPNAAHYTYVIEGGRHNLDICLSNGTFPLMIGSPDPSIKQTYIMRQMTIGTKTYYGIALCSWANPRSEAWAFRDVMLAAAVAPAALADGTVFGESQYFKDCVKDSCQYAAEVINAMPSAKANNGFWEFYNYQNCVWPPVPQSINSSGCSDPWMQAYVGIVWARARMLHGGESWGSALTIMTNMQQKYHIGMLNTRCSILSGAQTVNICYGRSTPQTYRDWSVIGTFSTQVDNISGGDVFQWMDFRDTANGWINLRSAGGTSSLPEVPFGVGATVFLTQDYFYDNLGSVRGSLAPPPFVMETQVYYVVAVDRKGNRIKLSATPAGAPIIPTSPVSNVLWCIVNLASCPATYVSNTNPSVARSFIGFANNGGKVVWQQMAIRAHRTAGDNADLAAADAQTIYRLTNSPLAPDFGSYPFLAVVV